MQPNPISNLAWLSNGTCWLLQIVEENSRHEAWAVLVLVGGFGGIGKNWSAAKRVWSALAKIQIQSTKVGARSIWQSGVWWVQGCFIRKLGIFKVGWIVNTRYLYSQPSGLGLGLWISGLGQAENFRIGGYPWEEAIRGPENTTAIDISREAMRYF